MQARRRLVMAAVALALGGAGVVGAPVARAAETVTVVCPDVASQLTDVPDAAQAEVDQGLATLEQQIEEVDARLAQEPDQAPSLLGDLRARRVSTIDSIVAAMTQAGSREPRGLRRLARCDVREDAGPAATESARRATPRPSPSPDRPTPSPTPSPSTASCPELAHRVAGTDDGREAGLLLRLAGLGTLADCASPGPAGGSPPPGPGPDGSGSASAVDDDAGVAPPWPGQVTLSAGSGVDPVTGAAILVLLLAGLTYLLIRVDVVRLTRAWVPARRGSGPN